MNTLTAKKLQQFVLDYDYEITLEQSERILDMLNDCYGVFTNVEIEEVTNYIVCGKESIFYDLYN